MPLQIQIVMSVTNSTTNTDSLDLGKLSGAVLTYEDGDGNTVVVEFDE
jgi:hypothetical protein